MRRLLQITTLWIIAMLFISCGDNSSGTDPEPTTGTLEVTTETGGEDQDSDGYMLTVGEQEHEMSVNESLTIQSMEQGSYDAELSGLASNCSVEGDNPQQAQVAAEEQVSITFTVNCEAIQQAPMISSVTPEEGTVGTEVTIEGSNFSSTASENQITFDGTKASVNSAAEDQLITQVPEGATDGPVEVSVGEETASGADFNVLPEPPSIRSITPQEGTVGTEVTIQGSNFSSTSSENTITFGGIEASVVSAAEDQLITQVPKGADDGPVEVTVAGETATGSDFDVITTGDVEVITSTSGANQDKDGYTLTLDSEDRKIGINETIMVEDLEEGSYNAELSEIADNCNVSNDNPRSFDVVLGETASVTFAVNCQDNSKGKIMFLSDRSESNYDQVYVMNADGTDERRITDNDQGIETPEISNDGTKFAYSVFYTENGFTTGKKGIFVMNVDGSNTRRITEIEEFTRHISWSPDDSKLVFSNKSDGDYEIYTVNADGSGLTQVTKNSVDDRYPTWSANGERIAFSSDRDGDPEIYVIDVGGSNLQQITNNSDVDTAPDWSPDGSRIAFESNRQSGINDHSIFTMDPDGSNVKRITQHSAGEYEPVWSPYGDKIVYHTNRDQSTDILKISVDGSGETNLTNKTNTVDKYPSWGRE